CVFPEGYDTCTDRLPGLFDHKRAVIEQRPIAPVEHLLCSGDRFFERFARVIDAAPICREHQRAKHRSIAPGGGAAGPGCVKRLLAQLEPHLQALFCHGSISRCFIYITYAAVFSWWLIACVRSGTYYPLCYSFFARR